MTRQAPTTIPPADPNVGFTTRIDRAIDELAAAIAASPEGLTPNQVDRIETTLLDR